MENTGLRITNKNDIRLIETPFIAHVNGDFVIVEKVLENEIRFLQKNNSTKIPPGLLIGVI
ncbi:MAG: hypothetical protein PHS04_06880 [Tissierellia bacterium]|nr:hypothetical protein [Tissierellia bacterium]